MMMDRVPISKGEGFFLAGNCQAKQPVLLSSPHSGSAYPVDFCNSALLRPDQLTVLDDGPVHQLLNFADEIGVPFVHAVFARAVVDLNRAPDECLPFLIGPVGSRKVKVTHRSRAGLGVIPTRIGVRPIYNRALPKADLCWRIDHVHAGYHRILQTSHRDLAKRFGQALLLDCHSMPASVSKYLGAEVDVTLGNCHGLSCQSGLIQSAKRFLQANGLRVSINDPYAGGYITHHHGKPEKGRPAMQIELRRSLFLNERMQLTKFAADLSNILKGLCLHLATEITLVQPRNSSSVDAA